MIPTRPKPTSSTGCSAKRRYFQETHGIYAQGVGQHTARLPRGWRDRLIPLCNENTDGVTGWCLERHDLCVSKLLAGRPKDIEFCRALIATGIAEPATLLERLAQCDATTADQERMRVFLRSAARPRRANELDNDTASADTQATTSTSASRSRADNLRGVIVASWLEDARASTLAASAWRPAVTCEYRSSVIWIPACPSRSW
jgi:hypothetical protein